ncbi:MAG: colicin-like pore-forming protein [Pantoea sp.]|uniref:colicin-like pore-forming protein n=1 Tax=Pantoea sp. TaxID=69393 RepID=UPI0039E29A59
MSDYDISYYQNGIPYNAGGEPIILITSGAVTSTTPATGISSDYGLGLALNSISLSVTVDPLALAQNVPEIHRQELTIVLQETDAKQKVLDAALVTAHQNAVAAGNTYMYLQSPTSLQRAQAYVNYQNAVVAELQARIASEQNAVTYIGNDIMLNNARIWWPDSDADAAAAQVYIDARQKDLDAINLLVLADQKQLATLQSQLTTVDTEADIIQNAVKITADFYGEVLDSAGEKASQTAQQLASAAQGKTLRSAQEALTAFNTYQGNILSKFGAQDLQAIANAIASADSTKMAQDMAQYSKALSLISIGLDVKDVVTSLVDAIETGDYSKFFLKVETVGAGMLATEIVAFVFAAMTGSVLGTLAFGLLMALTGAMITDKVISDVNDAIFK